MSANAPVSRSLTAQAAQEGAVVVQPKSPLTSKTMIVNLAMAVAGIALYLADTELVKQYPAEIAAGLLVASNLINAVLRVLTNSPLTPMVSDEVKEGIENRSADIRNFSIFFLALTVISSTALAETIPAANFNFVLANGKYRLVTKENPGGQEVTINILDLDRGTAPTDPTNPTDPVDPGDPFIAEVARMTKEVLANGGTSTTAAALSVVYSAISDAVLSGAISVDAAFTANRAGADLVLSRQPDKDKWIEWRAAISEDLTMLVAQGHLVTKEQYAGVFKDISKGMNLVTGFNGSITSPKSLVQHDPKAGIFSDFNITKLIELIRLIMDLIKTFSQAQGGPMPPAPLVEAVETQQG